MDPMDLLEEKESEDKKSDHLNSWVAVAIALLAAFMGICSIKDGNIVQNMQQSQATSIDTWNYYQAKNIREDIYQTTADQMRMQASTQTGLSGVSAAAKKADEYQQRADKEKTEKGKVQDDAKAADKAYNDWNFRDDQFDLADASISLAISLLAVTALTKKRWLFFIAMLPAIFGLVMGLSGLFAWKIHPDFLISPLTFLR
jgi:hypothetical protein